MAETSGYTIRQLLPEDFRSVGKALDQAHRDDPDLKSEKLPGMALRVAGERATQVVRDTLDTDVFELIARAWAKALELHKAADEADKSPDKTATVFLGKHEVSARVFPVVEVVFGVLGKLTLKLTLEFTATLELAEVTITDRHIVKIGRTEGHASAVLKYGEIDLHPELKSRKIPLHEGMVLKPPLPLLL